MPDEPTRTPRTYNGKVTAIIIIAIVVVFVLLNVVSAVLVREPDRAPQPPTVTVRPSP